MAQTSSLRFSSLVLSSSIPTSSSSSSHSRSHSLNPSFASHSSRLSWKSGGSRKITQKSPVKVKAVNGNEFWAPERRSSRTGIWSIRDDLQVPSSPYFPAYAYAQGQGPPPMAPERSSRTGIWSIRDDLQVPSSPYFPAYAQGQGPPPMVQEHFQSAISQLFQYRIIRCGGPVDDDMANIIVGQLLYLDAVNPNKDIVMYVNSPGGSVTAGMAVFDTMRHIRPDVSTVCVGLAASMGAFLLSAGTIGKRYSLPNARIMIHQPLGGIQGSQSDVEIQTNEMMHHKANLSGYLSYQTGQSLERINEDTDRDFFMSAEQAKEYGLVDGVIANPLKAFQQLSAAEEGKDRVSI